MSYVTIEDVEFLGTRSTGKSFDVKVEGETHCIPNFAVHDDSEIHSRTEYDRGTLVVREDIAEQKGLIDTPTRSTGGFPVKSDRLPPAPEMMPDARLEEIKSRVNDATPGLEGGECDDQQCDVVRPNGDLAACFEDIGDADLFEHAHRDLTDLVDQVEALQAWVKKVQENPPRRRRRR